MKDFPKTPEEFISECIPKVDKDRRIDLVRLNDETWFEFESSDKIKKTNSCTIHI